MKEDITVVRRVLQVYKGGIKGISTVWGLIELFSQYPLFSNLLCL